VAAREVFDDAFGQLRDAVDATPPDLLDRKPAGDDSNSMAVLATHGMHATRMWLSCAVGAAIPARDRPSEFRVTSAGPTDLLRSMDELARECRALLGTEADFAPGAEREEPSTTPNEPPPGTTVTAAWALLHALEHLREHAGQATLTSQLVGQGL
jgi:uncharacterized damage-inducible protein DinB